jgi:drug/metabolite transporter (DMT)-like permease
MLFAGLVLLLLAGPGRLAKDALTSPHSWYYGFCYLISTSIFVTAMHYISATQMSLLIKAVVPMSLIISVFCFKRHLDRTGWIGFALVLIGLVLVGLEIEPSVFGVVVALVFIFSFFETLQMLVSDIHSSNNKARKSIKESMRVTGMVLAATALLFLILCLCGAVGVEYIGLTHGVLPNIEDFINPWSFGLAFIYGVFGLSFIRYSEFVSNRAIKFEIFLAMTSLSVITTLFFEWLLSLYGFLEFKGLSLLEFVGGGIMIIGSAGAIYARAKPNKGTITRVNR